MVVPPGEGAREEGRGGGEEEEEKKRRKKKTSLRATNYFLRVSSAVEHEGFVSTRRGLYFPYFKRFINHA